MVERQVAGHGVRDEAVLAAMRTVPREAFVAPEMADLAYEDGPLPIGEGQTISQPSLVALMVEALAIGPGDRVLEVGAGSGYAAAILSRIAARVFAIERRPALGEAARARLARLGYDNIALHIGDGTRGWPEAAPFDAIIVSAGGRPIPPALKDQLAVGGRLVMPVGGFGGQRLLKLTRRSGTEFDEEDLGAVVFVSLVSG